MKNIPGPKTTPDKNWNLARNLSVGVSPGLLSTISLTLSFAKLNAVVIGLRS